MLNKENLWGYLRLGTMIGQLAPEQVALRGPCTPWTRGVGARKAPPIPRDIGETAEPKRKCSRNPASCFLVSERRRTTATRKPPNLPVSSGNDR